MATFGSVHHEGPGPVDVVWADRSRDAVHAWMSLLLYPVSLVGAFAVGEGLAAAMGYPAGGTEAAPWFVVLLAGVPALIVFVLPGLLALGYGRRAARSGARSALFPAVLGTLVALAFVALNVLAFFVSGL